MALLFADGFDLYQTDLTNRALDFAKSEFTKDTGNDHYIESGTGRFGGNSMRCGSSNDSCLGVTTARGNTLFVCFSYRHNGASSNTGNTGNFWFGLEDGQGNPLVHLRHLGNGGIEIFDARALYGAATGATGSQVILPTVLSADTWYWIELKVVLGTDSATGQIELRVNESVLFTSATNINTFRSANTVQTMSFGCPTGGVCLYDDFIIFDNTGSAPTNYIGDARIDTLQVNGNGAATSWSGSSTDIDDALGTPDDDTTYISSSTPGQKSSFTLTDLTVAPTTIHAVQPRIRGRKTDAGERTIRGYVRSGTSESNGLTLSPSTTYGWRRCGFFRNDPATSSVWTATAINSMQIGVEVVS